MPELNGCRVLIIEDEYFIARELESALSLAGACVIGPIPELSAAYDQVKRDGCDFAVLDINLRDEWAYPIADELTKQKIPFAFATGYGQEVLPKRFRTIMRWEKPYHLRLVIQHIAQHCRRQSRGSAA